MSTQPETRFKERVFKRLDEEFPRAWYTKIQAGSIRGIPDIIGIEEGCGFVLELKIEEGKEGPQYPLQRHNLYKIKDDAKGFAKVVYPETLEETISELKNHVRSVTKKHYR